MDSIEAQWHTRSSVLGGGGDNLQSGSAHRDLRFASTRNSSTHSTRTPHFAAPVSSSSAALDAYLAKYHQSEPLGRPQSMVDGNRPTGRQYHRSGANRHVLSTFLPREKVAQVQPESPLSRFKKQGARVAWETADARENDPENSDLSNIVTGDHHHQRFPVANAELPSILYGKHPLGKRVSVKEENLSLLLTSSSARAVLDRIRDAKMLGGQSKTKSSEPLSKAVDSQQQDPLLDKDKRQGSKGAKKPVDTDLSNNKVALDSVELLQDSQVELLFVSLPPVSTTPPQPAAPQQPYPETQAKLKPVSELLPKPPSPDKREKNRQKKKRSNVSVETIIKASNAAFSIQTAWKQRQERKHQQQQLSCSLRGSGDSFSGDDSDVTYTTGPSEGQKPQQPVYYLPRPHQSSLPQVNLTKAKHAREPSADAIPVQTVCNVPEQDDEVARCPNDLDPITVTQEPIEALWVEDEWVCLEEGGYLGALEDTFGSQDPLSRKQNEDNFLIWRHPQRLIQRCESERIAWWQQRKKHTSTAKMAPSDFGDCNELQVRPTPCIPTQTESKDTRGALAQSEVANHVDLVDTLARKVLHIPLQKYRLARKNRRVKRIRIQVSSTRGGQRAQIVETQDPSEVEAKRPTTLDGEFSVEGDDGESHSLVMDFNTFVVFSSPVDENANETTNDQRNDLIPIDSVGVRGAALPWSSVASSDLSHDRSRDPDQRNQSAACGFIPSHSVIIERMSSTVFSTRPSAASRYRLGSGEAINTTKESMHASVSLHLTSGVYDTSAVNRGGDDTEQTEFGRMEFEAGTNENGSEDVQAVVENELAPEGEPTIGICQPFTLEKRHLVKDFGDAIGNQLGNDEASAPIERPWQCHESSLQVEAVSKAIEMQRPPVRVDPTKKEEFRLILDEFKASLRQSASASYSRTFASSTPVSQYSGSSTSSKAKLSSASCFLADEPNRTSARDTEEDEDTDEELQAMLQEINTFKQQFTSGINNNGAPGRRS